MPDKRRKNQKVIKDFEVLVESLFNNREINIQYDESMLRISLIVENNYRISFQRKPGTRKFVLTNFCDLKAVPRAEREFHANIEAKFDIRRIPEPKYVL